MAGLQMSDLVASQTSAPPTYGQQGQLTNGPTATANSSQGMTAANYTSGLTGAADTAAKAAAFPTTGPTTPITPPPPTPVQNALTQAQQSGAPPQTQAGAAGATSAVTATPTFYKPTTPVAGYDPATIFDASGKALTASDYAAAGGKADYSNVQAGSPPQTAPPLTNTPATIAAQLANDPGWQTLLQDSKNIQSTVQQSQTLQQQYTDLMNQYNIPAINAQLISDQAIINGTQDDIRTEVTKSGGFADESQVQALAVSRNKTLITNYNNLLATKTDAMNTINTMIGLASQDKTFAQTAANNQLGVDEKLASYAQQFTANAKEGYNAVISAVGYAGLYAGLQNDPNSVALAEQTLGLPNGTLAKIAAIPNPAAQLQAVQLAQAKMNLADTPAKDQAAINASNASASASAASAAISRANLDFMNSHGGLNQTEYAASQKPVQDQALVQQNTTDLQTYLTSQAGSDGYVSPDSWAKALSAWEADYAGTGITPPNFTDIFSQFANPKITTQYTTGTTLGKK